MPHTDYQPQQPEVLAFWGAGATIELGGRTTAQIGEALSRLAGWVGDKKAPEKGEQHRRGDPPGFDYSHHLQSRIRGFADNRSRRWPETHINALRDLLLLLGDGDGCDTARKAEDKREQTINELAARYTSNSFLSERGLSGSGYRPDREAIIVQELRSLKDRYDWLGLKSIFPFISRTLNIPRRERGSVYLQDLLTAIEQLAQLEGGVPTVSLFIGDRSDDRDGKSRNNPLRPERLAAVSAAATLLTGVIMRLSFQDEQGRLDRGKAKPYRDFVEALVRLNVEEAQAFERFPANDRRFYLGSLAVVSLNWDPLFQWFWFNANKEYNHGERRNRAGEPHRINCKRLHLMHDQGAEMGTQTIDGEERDNPKPGAFFAFTEQACQRLNDPEKSEGADYIYRYNKFLQVHGGFQWRDCPRCGKIFMTVPGHWGYEDGTMLGPDVLPEFSPDWKPRLPDEKREWSEGRFGAVQCIHCGYMTQPLDTPILTQTVLKPSRHYQQWALFREMGVLAANARHILLIGYSLPPDDVINRCFLQSAAAGWKEPAFVTVVTFDDCRQVKALCDSDGFLRGSGRIWDFLRLSPQKGEVDEGAYNTVKSVVEVWGDERVRFSFDGFPNVLRRIDGDTLKAVKELFYPREADDLQFPPERRRDP